MVAASAILRAPNAIGSDVVVIEATIGKREVAATARRERDARARGVTVGSPHHVIETAARTARRRERNRLNDRRE
jgi:hypothetical protein